MDAINFESLKGVQTLNSKLVKLTARHCISSMKVFFYFWTFLRFS